MKFKPQFLFFALICLMVFSTPVFAVSPLVKQDINKAVRIKNGQLVSRDIFFQNDDLYWIRTVKFNKTADRPYVMTIKIPGTKAYVRYLETKNGKPVWKYVKCPENLPLTTCFLQTDKFNMIISMANVYKKGPYNTIKMQPQYISPLKLKKIKDGYVLSIFFRQKKGMVGEFWALQSKSTLIEWSKPVVSFVWSGYDLNKDRKWTNEGFYLRTPGTYKPSGPNVFWRCPSNFVVGCFVENNDCRAAEDLGWVMLKTVLPFQNKDGYWETGPRSEWLWKDYRVGYNFYDNRFNSNLALYLLKGYKRYQDPEFLGASVKYSKWLISYAANNHFSVGTAVYNQVYTENLLYPENQAHSENQGYIESDEGWLVPDYGYSMPHKPTHVSLNHQLQQINYLFEMFLTTRYDSCKDAADKMLRGIKSTTPKWVKKDGNLYYAFFPDGKTGMEDYPYLTYNDLYLTQKLLTRINGKRDGDLQMLMDSKKRWMDVNRIQGYYSFA